MIKVVETKSQNTGWVVNQTGYLNALFIPVLQIWPFYLFMSIIIFLFHPCAGSSDLETKETLSASKLMFLYKGMPMLAIL